MGHHIDAMTDALPLTQPYNLSRLGVAGDTVTFSADADQRLAIAAWSGVLSIDSFSATVILRKLAPTRFGLDFTVTADVQQACVVTLEPVLGHLETRFSRELLFTGPARRKPEKSESSADLVLDAGEEEGPEEIESLHFDLAGPVLEEYVLALEPYPRCPGVAFSPQSDASDRPESPFAVLKGLK
jgi:uncharacterized metal-binding protein YceD (DUF177 family)